MSGHQPRTPITPSASQTRLHGDEPPMFLQRPSSARSQDISHILAQTFRQLFTRDSVAPDTVQYLNQSKGGDDPYHEGYVDALQKIHEERNRRLAETAMLERHIMQAQARAMSADEREINRIHANTQGFPDLGLPPARSHFRSCIDTALLQRHNLITPDDFAAEEMPIVPPPSGPPVPNYARDTQSSHLHKSQDLMESPIPSPRGSLGSGHQASECDTDSNLDSLPKLPETAVGKPRGDLWKNQLDQETRQQNRTDLQNLQQKVDYLKNPRHVPPSANSKAGRTLVKGHKKKPKEVGIKPKPEPEKEIPKEPSVIFVASPEVVTFKDYQVGKVYEISLELKNITAVLRPVRIIPPRTQYFSVGLGQFPGEKGVVAPGMSCHFNIRFIPDSLADFDDYIMVHTQSSTPVIVQLQGRRPPPVLTLPDDLDIGQCLVGGMKVAKFTVKNTGGQGRFCMMPTSTWPSNSYKSAISTGAVTMEPFEIRPSVFHLRKNEATEIEVLFTPPATESYTEKLTLVCDNCHVKHMTVLGEGVVAGVELTDVEGGLSEQLADELCDISAQHLIKFENLNPYTYIQKSVTVKNLVNVDLPYSWVLVKPYIKPEDPRDTDTQPIPTERVQEVTPAITVEPEKGVLPSGGKGEFLVTFAPPEEGKYNTVLHMVLRKIPKPRIQEITEGEEEDKKPKGKAPLEEYMDIEVEDVTALEIEAKGECEPLNVILQPYAVHLPGQIMVETSVKRQFRMLNMSMTSIIFHWETISNENHIVEVEPSLGELPPHSELDFDLSLSGSHPGKIDYTLQCKVHHMEEPLMLPVYAEIQGPEVSIEQSDVNFGLVRLGETVGQCITVRNLCRVPAKWVLDESAAHRPDTEEAELSFSPSSGELRPLESMEVEVTFTPKTCKTLQSVIEMKVAEGNESFTNMLLGGDDEREAYRKQSALMVRAEVQSPEVCLVSSHLTMDEVYLDVPTARTIELLNQTLLDTSFEWLPVEGEQSNVVSIIMEPQSGIIQSRQKLNITVHFTAHTTGPIKDLKVPCKIGGMDTKVHLALSLEVQGLSVVYTTPREEGESSSNELKLDFGKGINLGETVKRFVHIRNQTAITAPFSLQLDYFFAKPPTPPEKRLNGQMPNKAQRRGMLNKTPNLADPLSRTNERAHADLCKTVLRENKGCAFTVTPSSGVLQPFGEQIVEVVGFSDMWGEYQDKLLCKVEKLDLVEIPITMGVSGCPLSFQMVAAAKNQQPILRFGTTVSGVKPITRQMRINNSGPTDVRLDWQVFNQNGKDSRQLLDFIVTYGKPFPLLDDKGNEIPPGITAPPPLTRQPTEYIPNSPDSTPLVTSEKFHPSTRENTPAFITEAENSEAIPEIENTDAQPENTEHNAESDSALVLPPTRDSPMLEPKRPKLIQVTLRDHGGVMKTNPYNITPSQVIIPAKGNACINVTLTPHPTEEVTEGIDCNGFALGYMSLTDRESDLSERMLRPQAYAVKPLRLDMTSHCKPALLTLECHEEDGMRYRAAASDLMQEGQLAPEALKICSVTLANKTETPLQFRLITGEPFHLVDLDESGRAIAQLVQTDMCTLLPRHSMRVQVAFRICTELLGNWDNFADKPNDKVEVETGDNHERKIHFKDNMVVEFNNQSRQLLPLFATLTMPSLVLSKDTLDFGTCLVGQTRELQMILSNPTPSGSYWMAVQERKSDNCDTNTFTVTPSSGMLDAHISHVSRNKVLLQVFFTAKHSEEYECTMLFHGMLGEGSKKLILKGLGSYDGKHEAIVNV